MARASRQLRGADTGDEAFIRCRTFSHAWDEFYPIDLAAPRYGWRLSLRCMRCQTERHDNLDFKGRVMSRRYLYVEGYQTPKGEEKPEKSYFREELFTRLRAQLEEHSAVGQNMSEVTPIESAKKAGATASTKTTRKRA